MCGIAGFNWRSESKLKNMIHSIRSRGPDDKGSFMSDNLSLGHTRLSIIDLSSAGHQPMIDNVNKNLIIYNGEIYNFKEIKSILIQKGHEFSTKTDTEVLLKGYLEWGSDIVHKLIGMFSFVIYEPSKNQLFIARDHAGIKPLYYYLNDGKFIFSSTIPAILEHDITRTPNERLIRDFLLYNNVDFADETFFNEINRFPKGTFGFFDLAKKELTTKKWWDINFDNSYNGSYKKATKIIRKLLKKSVNQRLMSDVPVGTCLSGGIDSSAIASFIDEDAKSDISTFSAVFGDFRLDESYYIDLISKEKNMANFKVSPNIEDLLNDSDGFLKSHGEPIPGPSVYAQNKVFELAKEQEVTVLLDGQGADELFAGYHYFFGFYFFGLIKNYKFKTLMHEILFVIKNKEFKYAFFSLCFLLLPTPLKKSFFRRKSYISESLYNSKENTTNYYKNFYSCNSLHDCLNFHLHHKLEHLLSWKIKTQWHTLEKVEFRFSINV